MSQAVAISQVNLPHAGLPQTGRSYLDSLDDGRSVFIEGASVGCVTRHPAFAEAARSIASLYDAVHDPARRDELTIPADAAGPAPHRTHRAFRVARDTSELTAQRRAIAAWSAMTFGWMGRTPDYKASLTNTFGPSAPWYGPFESSARQWYARAQRDNPFLSHALVNPPIDRHQKPEQNADVVIRIVAEDDAGIVVSGAKVVATSAAISQYLFIGQTPGTASEDPTQAVAFIIPINAPGLRLFCRPSYEHAARRAQSPSDYPLSRRFDENDAIITLDRVRVPWEDVLIHRDPARVRGFFHETGFQSGFLFHGCVRLGTKLDFMAGLLSKALRATGGDEARANRAALGEVIAWAHALHALADAMAHHPDPWPNSCSDAPAVAPQRRAALASAVLAPQAWAAVRSIIETVMGSALVYLPSSAADLLDADAGPTLARFVRGSRGMDAHERVKIMKLLWDATGSEFAGRHALYERHYAGSPEACRLQAWIDADRSGHLASLEAFAERCLASDAAPARPRSREAA